MAQLNLTLVDRQHNHNASSTYATTSFSASSIKMSFRDIAKATPHLGDSNGSAVIHEEEYSSCAKENQGSASIMVSKEQSRVQANRDYGWRNVREVFAIHSHSTFAQAAGLRKPYERLPWNTSSIEHCLYLRHPRQSVLMDGAYT